MTIQYQLDTPTANGQVRVQREQHHGHRVVRFSGRGIELELTVDEAISIAAGLRLMAGLTIDGSELGAQRGLGVTAV